MEGVNLDIKVRKSLWTAFTTSSARLLPCFHQDLPIGQECYDKNSLSPSPCRYGKIRMTSITKTEPARKGKNSKERWITDFAAHLCGNIGKRSFSHRLHTVQVSITRACSFRLPLYRAWRCEDVFEALRKKFLLLRMYRQYNELTKTSISLLSRPFQGSSGSYTYPAYKNMGHWLPRTVV